ncbi:c-type cytochrome [Oceanibaculum pacificum]|uniref:Cytochrome C n=1 Tax=Oceanibaculum pacificum TaxID=580166 RepID=A0A154W868_9PROT|nr:c-type cytochrome [Oceanibaculum pacificum]KZD09717.1 cytochrome C [Oceanibaculum pacificum]
MPFDRVAALVVTVLATAVSPSAFAQDAAEGERQFRTRCASCHSTEAGQNRVGPHLSGILGRTAGAVEGARYSAAMKSSGIVWDAQQIDAYLANPRQLVPGTSMPVGLPNAGQRAQVIEYLRSLSGGNG